MAFNLKTQKALTKLREEGLPRDIATGADIVEFCRTLQSVDLRCGKHDLLLLHVNQGDPNHCAVFVKKRNLLFYSGFEWPFKGYYGVTDIDPFDAQNFDPENMERRIGENIDDVPSAAIVNCPKRLKANEGFRSLLLLNADTDNATYEPQYQLVEEFGDQAFPVVSFSALAHMYDDDFSTVCARLADGRLRLKDYSADERIPFTEEEKKQARRKKPDLTPPELGFVQVGNQWHRSGFALLHDEADKLCLLAGQDEGSYFIVELPKKVNSIADAMEALIPEEARVHGAVRQGEWFLVPCDKEEVPSLNDTVLLIDHGSAAYLPLDDENSNHHTIETSDGRVGKDGYLYLKDPTLEHDEHQSVSIEGWCYVVKNTAVRSFSVSGVD